MLLDVSRLNLNFGETRSKTEFLFNFFRFRLRNSPTEAVDFFAHLLMLAEALTHNLRFDENILKSCVALRIFGVLRKEGVDGFGTRFDIARLADKSIFQTEFNAWRIMLQNSNKFYHFLLNAI